MKRLTGVLNALFVTNSSLEDSYNSYSSVSWEVKFTDEIVLEAKYGTDWKENEFLSTEKSYK